MFCSKCGKRLADDAKFCDACGARVGGENPPVEKKEGPVREGKVFKCPHCGEILPYDAVRCPTCGNEIRGRENNSTVQSFFEKLEKVDDYKKIELITTYPVPNSREDILEFMYMAYNAFDAKYYATNKRKESVHAAWLTKIDLCYQKAKVMFTDKADLARAEEIYNKVHSDIQKTSRIKLILIIGGFIGIAAGLVIVVTTGQTNLGIGSIGLVLLAIGIVALVFGFKRKKTRREIEEAKAKKNGTPLPAPAPQKEIVRETTIIREQAKPTVVYVDRPAVSQGNTSRVNEVSEEKEVTKTTEVESITYSRAEIEISKTFVLKPGERVLVKADGLLMDDGTDDTYDVVVTDQAVYYLLTDDEGVRKSTRIPLCQISQAIFNKRGFLEGNYLEIYREGATDHFESSKMLPILELAINDRFNPTTVNRDHSYYSKLDPKNLK